MMAEDGYEAGGSNRIALEALKIDFKMLGINKSIWIKLPCLINSRGHRLSGWLRKIIGWPLGGRR